ncbi:M50 family metallopeptidase [Clostridium sp. YIM B02505]|uniref:M50 family metallopeptidase n=1 Tax=Clostridium yunnanense TaxID=2800325 RepID=A0ABS1EJW7_9CLOT|nr:M50 family metallopeptidase [Clostridium yunnanense]MBK1809660.1 M50 family metallopeptidase [Clostridium yunnanense]
MANKKSTIDATINLIFGLAVGVALAFIFVKRQSIKVLHLPTENIKPYHWIAVIILFFLVFYLHLALHEIGHLIAGSLVRFKLFSYKIGPFGWYRENDELKYGTERNLGYGSRCSMLPTSTDRIYSRLAVYSLGGIIVNVILSLVFFLGSVYIAPKENNFLLSAFFILGWGVGIFTVLINIIPFSNKGFKTDGLLALSVIRKSPDDMAQLATVLVSNQLMAGIRPRHINPSFFSENNYIADNDISGVVMNYYRFYHFLDLGDEDRAMNFIRLIEENIEVYPEHYRAEMLYNVFYAYCAISKDSSKSKDIFEKIKNSISQNDTISGYRVKMAYELYINNDYKKVIELGRYGLGVKDSYPVRGEAIFEADQIEKMIDSAKKNLSD